MKFVKFNKDAVDFNREVRRVVGANLRRLREAKDMTRDEFGAEFGISPYSVRNFESGEKSPKIPTLVKYADFYDLSLDELLGRNSYVDKIIFDYRLKTAKEMIGRYAEIDDTGKNTIIVHRDAVKEILPTKGESKADEPPATLVCFSYKNFVMFYENLIFQTSIPKIFRCNL